MSEQAYSPEKYFRDNAFPTMWCGGCGIGTILNSLFRSIDSLGWNKDDIVFVSGIGCSARAPSYLDLHGVQCTHGRALSFATGIKLANPKLKVVVVIGDGDAAAIGGNHLLHTARRNIDITLVVINNMIYGMTGGQVSPLSGMGTISTTSPYGNIEPPLDLCKVSSAAGASYAARITASHIKKMDEYMTKGLQNPGFSVVEVMSPCHTNYGRRNKFASNVDILKHFQQNGVFVQDDWDAPLEEGKIALGELPVQQRPEMTSEYYRITDEVMAKAAAETPEEPLSLPAGRIDRRTDVRLSGLGGYGLVLSGVMFAETAVNSRVNATQVTSYGPEARGGVSRTDMVLAPWDSDIYHPEVVDSHIVFALTQESLEKYGPQAEELLVIDGRLHPEGINFREGVQVVQLPILAAAMEHAGTPLVVGTVCLGVLNKYLGCFPLESLAAEMQRRFKPKVYEKNYAALSAGFDMMNLRRAAE